jgi:hypothetical protein
MGQTARATRLLLELGARDQGGANSRKRWYLEETVALLNAARRSFCWGRQKLLLSISVYRFGQRLTPRAMFREAPT